MKVKVMILKAIALVALLLTLPLMGKAKEYVVTDYGVPEDTTQLASPCINAAITDCANHGGGKVVVPAGKYRCGTIFLKSHVELHLEAGALLYATDGYEHFPMQPRASYRSQKDKGGWNALIFAVDCEDIAVTGLGTVDGRGKGRKGYLKDVPGDGNGRPKNLLFISCKRVRVSGIKMFNSALWNQHYLNCEDVVVDGIQVYNHCNANNDGIDIDGCRRFLLSNSVFDCDDDGIVLKSTGLAPCEDIIVKGCVVSSFANAIKCGTESVGGFRNILISDCIVKPSRHQGDRIVKSTPSGITAISLVLVDGGSLEHVTVNNILIEGTEAPLYVRLANRGRRKIEDMESIMKKEVGTLRHVTISNISAWDCGTFGSSITGIPEHCVEDITLSNIHVQSKGGLRKGNYRTPRDLGGKRHDMAGNLFPDRYWEKVEQLAEDETGYPQPTVWGNLPCHGLLVRHARGVRLNNVHFSTSTPDPRKAITMDDVEEKSKMTCHVLNFFSNFAPSIYPELSNGADETTTDTPHIPLQPFLSRTRWTGKD